MGPGSETSRQGGLCARSAWGTLHGSLLPWAGWARIGLENNCPWKHLELLAEAGRHLQDPLPHFLHSKAGPTNTHDEVILDTDGIPPCASVYVQDLP